MYLGIYHSPFNQGCGQDPRIGGAGHERIDAQTFADWGVDYLKYDWCRPQAPTHLQVHYFSAMRDALRATGRRIFYSINPNSSDDAAAGTRYDWSKIADMNRNSVDLVPCFATPEAALIEKGRFEERRGRGEVAIGRMRFEPSWERYLAYKRPRISDGAYENLERDGRNHILPFFARATAAAVDGTVVERWMQQFADDVEDERIAPRRSTTGARTCRRSSNGAARAPTSPW